MKVMTLVEDTEKSGYWSEHGLSLYIEYGRKNILLDAGQSDNFLKNAERLGVDIKKANFAVLSHAHYDHGNGFRYFFEKNKDAQLFLSKNVRENCYGGDDKHYVGIEKGFLRKNWWRLCRVRRVRELTEGAYLVPRRTKGLEKAGEEQKLYRLEKGEMVPDDFNHELTLVLKERNGLVVINSCSHAGADVILDEVQAAFPGERLYAYFGGLHLSKRSDEYVREYAEKLKKYKLVIMYIGHCTGERAFQILDEVLEDTYLETMESGKNLLF